MPFTMTSFWHSRHAPSRLGRKKISRPGLRESWSLVGLVAVVALALVAATLMLSFLPEHMLREKAVLTMELVRSAVLPKKPVREIRPATGGPNNRKQAMPEPISHLRDTLPTA